MSAPIVAGGHRFRQEIVGRDKLDRPSHHLWVCERCGVEVDPSDPFIDCVAVERAS